MKISNIQKVVGETHTTLKADCEMRHFGTDEVIFRVENKYADFLYEDGSSFAAALLIPSMRLGQDLIIEGSVSKKCIQNLQEIMDIFLSWNLPLKLKRINIIANTVAEDTVSPFGVGGFFSGGLDSYYTFLKQKEGDDPIEYFILIKGFDIDHRNPKLWEVTETNVYEIAQDEGTKVLTIETNVRQLIEPIVWWGFGHGGCLGAISLALRNGLRKVYIPSSLDVAEQTPWGSHPETDPLFGTEVLTIVHDGTEATRVQKVEWQVSKSPSALKHLRVCYENKKGKYNCGVCEKCLRTMIAFHIVGALDKLETLPHTIDVKKVASFPIYSAYHELPFRENLRALRLSGKKDPELEQALQNAINNTISPYPYWWTGIFTWLMYYDHVYLRGMIRKIAAPFLGMKF